MNLATHYTDYTDYFFRVAAAFLAELERDAAERFFAALRA
jgi:hypothetical protein